MVENHESARPWPSQDQRGSTDGRQQNTDQEDELRADLYRFDVELHEEDGAWRITTLKLTRLRIDATPASKLSSSAGSAPDTPRYDLQFQFSSTAIA